MEGWLALWLASLFVTFGYATGREWYLSRRPRPRVTTVRTTLVQMEMARRECFEQARTLLTSTDPVERWILAGGDASLEEFLEREGPTSRP